MIFNSAAADLAAAFGNAGVMVVGTPALIGFLETPAAECVASMLEPGDASVGTAINVQHLSAAPAFAQIGGPVAAEPKMQFSLAVAASFPPTVSADLRLTLLPIRKHT